jgi:hypothetical protein
MLSHIQGFSFDGDRYVPYQSLRFNIHKEPFGLSGWILS